MGGDEIYFGKQMKFITVVSNLETGEPLWFGQDRKPYEFSCRAKYPKAAPSKMAIGRAILSFVVSVIRVGEVFAETAIMSARFKSHFKSHVGRSPQRQLFSKLLSTHTAESLRQELVSGLIAKQP
jgi:hypothetical protein